MTTLIIQHRRSINLVFRTIGNTLVILAIILLGLGFWPYLEAEFGYNWKQLIGQRHYVAGDSVEEVSSPLGAIVAAPPPIAVSPVNTSFSIVIPKIEVNSAIVQEVNAGNYQEYINALNLGAAHAKGTVYPGQEGNSFIFAHSTLNFWDIARHKAVFTLLRKLEPGDHIAAFYNGQRYDYYVTEKKVVDPDDLSDLTASASGKQLTLQTCDPPGTLFKRLIVIAKMR